MYAIRFGHMPLPWVAAIVLSACATTAPSMAPEPAPKQVEAPASESPPPAAQPAEDPAPSAAEEKPVQDAPPPPAPAEKAPEPDPAPVVEATEPETPPDQTIYFGLSQYAVENEDRSRLAALAAKLRENPLSHALLHAYTDASGSREFNLALAERRGRSVQEVLTSFGIPARRVRIVPYGEERPNGASALRRRVDIFLIMPQR